MKRFLIWLIKGYRIFISPLFPPSCRFQPTCSEYALIAMTKFGTFKGSGLTLKRLLRCHPFHSGGYDPVPGVSTLDYKSLSEVIKDLELRRKAAQIKENNLEK